jgi:two-component system chemotaxis sensor kinase CheA
VGADALESELIRGFVGEAAEICERVAREILELERDKREVKDPQGRYDIVARGLHTLKGSAGSIGLKDLSQLAHRMEDWVLPLRREGLEVPREVADALLQGLDLFMVRARAHADGVVQPDIAAVLRDDPRFAGFGRAESGEGLPRAKVPRAGEAPRASEDDAEARTFRVEPQDIVGLMALVERLREIRLRIDERHRDTQLSVERLQAAPGTRDVETLAILTGMGQGLRADGSDTAEIIDDLEARLKGIGTQPMRTILDPLHRTVRDLCREMGKEAALSLVGGEISVDRRVLPVLKETLVQLIRNALDHGIEIPDERERRGKHRQGLVVVRAEQQGNLIFVEVADDGSGLDLARIREAALAGGYLDGERAASLDPQATQELIFSSGLSTRGVVTETSGRGLGMDIVRRQVERLHGRVEVESRANEGTRFILTLPAPLGSTSLLLIRCAEQELGIPMMAVERIVAAQRDTAVLGPNGMTLTYGEGTLPLVDLGAVLALRHPGLPSPGQPLLIVQSQGSRAALTVDDVLGDRELAIRPLPREVASTPAFQGASTTARGDVVLILRPDWLVSARATTPLAATSGRALVVDDSLTARALHRAMLEAGGYEVHAVSSASQAATRLARLGYDIVVCDVAMEPMDGFAFVEKLREEGVARETPVILVSGQGSLGEETRALAAGADAFLTKASCASGRLLEEVTRVIAKRKSAA